MIDLITGGHTVSRGTLLATARLRNTSAPGASLRRAVAIVASVGASVGIVGIIVGTLMRSPIFHHPKAPKP